MLKFIEKMICDRFYTNSNSYDVIGPDKTRNLFTLWAHLIRKSESPQSDCQFGPRGGVYTLEWSKNGGTYKRYR